MGDVVDVLHGSWTQNIHIGLCGFGTDRPLLGRTLSFALCCTLRSWLFGTWRLQSVWVLRMSMQEILTDFNQMFLFVFYENEKWIEFFLPFLVASAHTIDTWINSEKNIYFRKTEPLLVNACENAFLDFKLMLQSALTEMISKSCLSSPMCSSFMRSFVVCCCLSRVVLVTGHGNIYMGLIHQLAFQVGLGSFLPWPPHTNPHCFGTRKNNMMSDDHIVRLWSYIHKLRNRNFPEYSNN